MFAKCFSLLHFQPGAVLADAHIYFNSVLAVHGMKPAGNGKKLMAPYPSPRHIKALNINI